MKVILILFFLLILIKFQVTRYNFKVRSAEIFSLAAHDFSDSTNFRERNNWSLYNTQGVDRVLYNSWEGMVEKFTCNLSFYKQSQILAYNIGLCLSFCLLFWKSIFFFWKFSATDVIKQLSGPLLVRMIHTRDGSRVGMLCVKHGSAKVDSYHIHVQIFIINMQRFFG